MAGLTLTPTLTLTLTKALLVAGAAESVCWGALPCETTVDYFAEATTPTPYPYPYPHP